MSGEFGEWCCVRGSCCVREAVSKLFRAEAGACVQGPECTEEQELSSPQPSTSVGRRVHSSTTCWRGCARFPCLPEHLSPWSMPFIHGCLYLLLTDSLTWVHTVRVAGVCDKSLEPGNYLLKGRCLKPHIEVEMCSLTFRWAENIPKALIANIWKQNNRTTQ